MPSHPLEIAISERPRRTRTVVTLEATVAGNFVGHAIIECGQPHVYFEDLWVEPAFRGQGIGDYLLNRAIQEARARNGVTMQCDPIPYEYTNTRTRVTSPRAAQEQLQRWYAKRGFARVVDEDVDGDVLAEGSAQTLWERSL